MAPDWLWGGLVHLNIYLFGIRSEHIVCFGGSKSQTKGFWLCRKIIYGCVSTAPFLDKICFVDMIITICIPGKVFQCGVALNPWRYVLRRIKLLDRFLAYLILLSRIYCHVLKCNDTLRCCSDIFQDCWHICYSWKLVKSCKKKYL